MEPLENFLHESESLIYTSERKPELLCKDGAGGCKNKDRLVRRFLSSTRGHRRTCIRVGEGVVLVRRVGLRYIWKYS